MNPCKRIFIVGHSGAGKGILAAEVAKKLGWQFFDADFSLAATIGRPAAEIIGKPGEAHFHECLSEVLYHQTKRENTVVTTDDSIVCLEKNRQILAKEFTVYLKVSTPVQLARMGHNRPLLPVSNYRGFLDQLHHERDALYEEVAQLTVNSDDNALEEHTHIIIKAVQKTLLTT